MINESLLGGNQSGQVVLLSYFPSADDAQLAVADLMAERLSEQDFTLVKLATSDAGRTDPLEYVVAPFAGAQSSISDDTEDSAERESEIGAGIATSTADDDVSAPQEMDDSETAADDEMYPVGDHSIGDEESRDVEIAAETGFFETTRPNWSHRRASEAAVDEVDLPGIGAMVGEGSFGAIVLEKAFQDHDLSFAWLAARLNLRSGEQGVSIGKTGALLAVDVNAQGPNPDRIEEVFNDHSAAWTRRL